MAFCRRCGAELREGVRFCSKCGVPVQIISEREETQGESVLTYSTKTFEYRKRKKSILLALLGWAFFGGCLPAVLSFFSCSSDSVEFIAVLFGIVSTIMIISWCYADALDRNYQLSKSMKVFLILCLLIALPIYLFKSRSLGGFKALLLSTLFLLAMLVVAALAAVVSSLAGSLLGIS